MNRIEAEIIMKNARQYSIYDVHNAMYTLGYIPYNNNQQDCQNYYEGKHDSNDYAGWDSDNWSGGGEL